MRKLSRPRNTPSRDADQGILSWELTACCQQVYSDCSSAVAFLLSIISHLPLDAFFYIRSGIGMAEEFTDLLNAGLDYFGRWFVGILTRCLAEPIIHLCSCVITFT